MPKLTEEFYNNCVTQGLKDRKRRRIKNITKTIIVVSLYLLQLGALGLILSYIKCPDSIFLKILCIAGLITLTVSFINAHILATHIFSEVITRYKNSPIKSEKPPSDVTTFAPFTYLLILFLWPIYRVFGYKDEF